MKSVRHKISSKGIYNSAFNSACKIKHFGSDNLVVDSLSMRLFPSPRYAYTSDAVLIDRMIEARLIEIVGKK